jgi:hypothetical protein
MYKFIITVVLFFLASLYTPTQTHAQSLRWPAPTLTNPTTINITDTTGPINVNMNTSLDYIVNLPNTPITQGKVALIGGRNVVVIGGEFNINIDTTGYPGTGTWKIPERTMISIHNNVGIVHIEGILGRGPDISEGIQLTSPNSIVQIQNVRMEHLRAIDQVNFRDNHPDCIQAYGGYKELRVDNFTCSTDYQGILISQDLAETPLGPTYISNTNIVSDPTARYTFWYGGDGDFVGGTNIVNLNNIWLNVYEGQRTLKTSIWPETGTTISTDPVTGSLYATFSSSKISGRIYEGTPMQGDFVPTGVAGIEYVSPTATCTLTGDINCDAIVNISDLSILLSNFGKTNMSKSQGDLSADGIIRIEDLSYLLFHFGETSQ